jgi:transcriptional regulator with XRE-family HTH domain
MSSFKENLKRARVLKGLNQEELANILGVKQASISQFERGDRIPTPKNLKKIAESLDVSIEELTGDKAGVVGQTQLMRKIKGLSPNSLETLGEMADFLRSKEETS